MISVLLLTMATGFVSTGHQKVYAASDFPTSDLGTKISPSSSPISSAKLTLSGFPGQTGDSVTCIGLSCHVHGIFGVTCTGSSNIVIPGIGEGRVRATFDAIVQQIATPGPMIVSVVVVISGLPGQTVPSLIQSTKGCPSCPPFHVTDRINIHGIGPGQATVQVS